MKIVMIDCQNKTEADIIALISLGEIDAYYCIVQAYEKKLLKYILRISNIALEDAENILQEVFLKVYKNIFSYKKEYAFSSWIYRIAHNVTLDALKKIPNQVSLDSDDTDSERSLLEMLDSGINLEKEFDGKLVGDKIRKLLFSIDVKYREVLVLKFLEEKSYEEISDILHIPSGTVATLINRGKQQLKQLALDNHLEQYI